MNKNIIATSVKIKRSTIKRSTIKRSTMQPMIKPLILPAMIILIQINHKKMMSNHLTYEQIQKNMQKTFLDQTPFYEQAKYVYKNTFYMLSNLIYISKSAINFTNATEDKNKIEQIINLPDSDTFDMAELRTKTKKALENNNDIYYDIVRWISGNCWLNTLITYGYSDKLSDIDKEIIQSIDKAIELVEPMSKSLVLFHGFEHFANYNESELKIGSKFTFGGILSKTSYFPVAQKFAEITNYFQPKYFIVYYQVGSKHIGLDIKRPPYDEYEYISRSGESFIVKNIYKRINGMKLETFYILEPIN